MVGRGLRAREEDKAKTEQKTTNTHRGKVEVNKENKDISPGYEIFFRINEWRNHVTIGIAILLVYNLESTNIHASVDKGLVIVDTRS